MYLVAINDIDYFFLRNLFITWYVIQTDDPIVIVAMVVTIAEPIINGITIDFQLISNKSTFILLMLNANLELTTWEPM